MGHPEFVVSPSINVQESLEANHIYSVTNQQEQTIEKIINALKKAGGNKAKAARILQLDRSTLYRKMRELHIDKDMFS